MSRLWLKVIKNHRIHEQYTRPCNWGEEKDVLVETCKQADLPCPIWLEKHEREYARFRRTSFTSEHFIEEIRFDKLDLEFIDDTDTQHKTRDPRNEF